MLELRNVLNEITSNETLSDFQKDYAQFVFANRPTDYFLEIAAKCLKKSVEDLIKKNTENA